MQIRRATTQDIDELDRLLSQVLEVHHQGRPDLFKTGVRKYTTDELKLMVTDDTRPIFVAEEHEGADHIWGYVFCQHIHPSKSHILEPVETLYIDDLCVDESARGAHVGRALYEYVLDYARAHGCYNVTLNVWACNEGAKGFYEHLGLVPQRYTMEQIL